MCVDCHILQCDKHDCKTPNCVSDCKDKLDVDNIDFLLCPHCDRSMLKEMEKQFKKSKLRLEKPDDDYDGA